MSLYPELDNLSFEQLIKRWHDCPPEGEDAFTFYAELGLKIRQKGKKGLKFLSDQIQIADEEHLAAILLALTFPPIEISNINQILLSYLDDERPLIIMQAIDGLTSLGYKEAFDKIFSLRDQPSPLVRGSVLRYLSRLFPEKAKELLIAALKDPDYLVRENGIDELDDLKVIEAIPHIRPLLNDPHPDVRLAAETALENLADRFGQKV